jgi:hypothetical protein
MGRSNGFSRVPFFEVDERTERVLKKEKPTASSGLFKVVTNNSKVA